MQQAACSIRHRGHHSLLWLLGVMLLFSVSSGRAQTAAPSTPADPADEVLATVNGTKITRRDFDQLIRQFRPQAAEWAEQNKGRVMRDLVTLELLAQESKKQQLDQAPDTRSQIMLQINQILARLLVNTYIAQHDVVTDDTIRQHYEAEKDSYRTEEQIAASHILVASEAEAQEVVKELQQGKDFAEVAKARSTGPSAPSGGDLGTFGRGRMVPEFEQAAFVLKEGEISAPVQTQFGYHIIKVTKHIPSQVQPLEEVKDTIRNQLVSASVDTLIEELRSKSSVTVVNPAYQF